MPVAFGSESTATSLARPKSRTFTRPSRVTMTLAGFKSRWTMPRSCAADRASASGTAISKNRERGKPPVGMSCVQGRALDELHGEKRMSPASSTE